MTVPEYEKKVNNEFFIACLVSDKKFRKMGGIEGLEHAIKFYLKNDEDALYRDKNIKIGQISIKDIMCTGDFTENLLKATKKENCIAANNSNATRNNIFGSNTFNHNHMAHDNSLIYNTDITYTRHIIVVHKYTDFYKMEGISFEDILKLRDWLSILDFQKVINGVHFKVLDLPERIDVLSNRIQTGNLIREFCTLHGFEELGMQWPKFLSCSEQNNLNLIEFEDTEMMALPVIVKPIDACATDEAHWMNLITEPLKNRFNLKGSLIQKFYEHFEILYKVYVIGEVIEIIARPSISSKTATGSPVLRFNTHKLKATQGDLCEEKKIEALERMKPLKSLIEKFAKALKEKLKLTWFGIDVILLDGTEKNESLRAAVIDINYMPGYDGIESLSNKLIKAVLDF